MAQSKLWTDKKKYTLSYGTYQTVVSPPASDLSPRWDRPSFEGLAASTLLSGESETGTISSKYHLGRKPTRSSPARTSAIAQSSKRENRTPSCGVKTRRPTSEGLALCIHSRSFESSWSAHQRPRFGSHVFSRLRTKRGSSRVLNVDVDSRTPCGERNPTKISGTPSRKDWK